LTDEEYYSSMDSDGEQIRPNRNFDRSNGCHAKCLMPPGFEVEEAESYPVFTGAFLDNTEYTEEILIQISTSSTKWVKKKADKNCLSANPDDCLVWCLVDVPGQTKTITVVTDTSRTKDYEYRKVKKLTKVEGKGVTEWRPVLCETNQTVSIISQIQNTLRAKEYYYGSTTGLMDTATKKALVAFQKESDLPVGNLDFDTLDALSINLD